jgi:hypothetical protein
MYRWIYFVTLSVCFSGCASQAQLQRNISLSPNEIRTTDNRTPEKKIQKRDSAFAAIQLLEDERFSPRAVDIFQSELVSSGVSVVHPINLEINEFRIGDYFPVRLSSIGQGWLGSMIVDALMDKNTDMTFAKNTKFATGTDSLFCIFIGKVNGIDVKVVTSEPYKISPFAGLVVNDPDYRRALNAVIRHAAEEAIRQSTLAQPEGASH